jgi:hypothetical protein
LDITIWICVFLPIFIVLITQHETQKREKQRFVLKAIKAHKKKGGADMSEIIKKFVGKECIITTMNENVTGKVETVEDNWIVLSPLGGKMDSSEIINIEYISRIREYPLNKVGKRKAVVG